VIGQLHCWSGILSLSVVVSCSGPYHREDFLMLSRSAVFFSLIILLTSARTICLAQDSLAWKFETGESLKYVVQQKTDMEMNLDGQQQTMSQSQTMDMVWKIASVDPNGTAKMGQIVERVQMATEGGPFGKVQFDSSNKEPVESPLVKSMAEVFRKIVGQEFGVTMQPTGRVEDVVVPASLLKALTESGAAGNAMNEQTLKQMMSQSAVTLPAKPINVGDTWESRQKVELPFGTMTVLSVLTYQGTKSGIASINIKPKIEITAKEGAPITVTIVKSDGSGTVSFDLAGGRISKSELDLTMELKVKQSGKTIQQMLRQRTSMALVP